MKQTAKALKTFFGGFGIPAYSETSVPDNTLPPYITYPLIEPEWNSKSSFYAVLWCRTKGYEDALTIADEIMEAVGEGLTLDIEGGHIVLYRETPSFQEMSDPDNDVKGLNLNMSMNAYHVAGV